MKIEKINKQEEMTLTRSQSTELKDSEQIDFQTLLNENAMNNLVLASQGLNLIQTDLTMQMDSMNISEKDALFFIDLTKNPQFSINIEQNQLINLGELTSANDIQGYKSMEVSKGLFNLITKAQETQKPVRLDFDNNVTVIMKVDKEGKITAEYYFSDMLLQLYLQE